MNINAKISLGLIFLLLGSFAVADDTPTCNGKPTTKIISTLEQFKKVDSTIFYSDSIRTSKYYLLEDTSNDDVVLIDLRLAPPVDIFGNPSYIPPSDRDLIVSFTAGKDSLCIAYEAGWNSVYVKNADYLNDKGVGTNLFVEDASPTATLKILGNRNRLYINTQEGSSGSGADIRVGKFMKSADIKTGNGNDKIIVENSSNPISRITVDSGAGDDQVYTSLYADDKNANIYINGGSGDDDLQAWGNANAIVVGGRGKDTIYASGHYAFLAGGKTSFKDFDLLETSLANSNESTLMDGYDPTNDQDLIDFDGDENSRSLILGSNSDDTLYGGKGKDYIKGYDENDLISGDNGDDKIYGGSGEDLLDGDSGNDRIYGEDNYDRLWGGPGDDTLKGGDGKDDLYGEGDDDKLYGDDGGDLLKGGSGDDELYGNDDDDTLYGNEDTDVLNGGANTDTCKDSSGTSKTSCENN